MLLTSEQMRQADHKTIHELGLPGVVLMENAGAGVEQSLWQRIPDLANGRVLVLAGKGNNGGDGFVVARRLLLRGVRVEVVLLGRGEDMAGDARINRDVFVKLGGTVREVVEEGGLSFLAPALAHARVVVDALLGTGLAKPVSGLYAQVIAAVNACGRPVCAVDLPSGVSADDGRILGCAVKAQWCVTFAAMKVGHRLFPGAGLCGEVVVVPIGIPDAFIDHPDHRIRRNLPQDLFLPPVGVEDHKGRFGHLLLVAGSAGKSGAAVMAARGALRGGVGLLTVASPRPAQRHLANHLPEAMTLPLPDDNQGQVGTGAREAILDLAGQFTTLAMGPGLGGGRWAFALVDEILARLDLPAVLDADALNLFVGKTRRIAKIASERSAPILLTPHPGEMARLLDLPTADVQKDRLLMARKGAAEWGAWVILKGAATVIAAPDGRVWINETGNPGLATGGSGDWLTGLMGALLARGADAQTAARLAVWAHGTAADQAALALGAQRGLLASDCVDYLPAILAGRCKGT